MTSTPQPHAAEREAQDPPTDVHQRSHVPASPTAGPGRARRTFSARVTAAIGAGALVVGAALGALTGGLVGGPGGPGGGPGGGPPGTSTSQDEAGTGSQGTAPGATGGTAGTDATGGTTGS